MGFTHCPLCVGLALVAALRFCAHGWLLVGSGLLGGTTVAPHPMERKAPPQGQSSSSGQAQLSLS